MKAPGRTDGFTLLELLVVLGLLGLMSTLAAEYLVNDVNRDRRDATAERIAEIRYAIAGDHSRTLNGMPAFSGYIADTGTLPKYVRDLLSNRYCTNVQYRNESDCVANGQEWREVSNWKGPYLRATTYKDVYDGSGSLVASIPVFRDAWGNRSSDGDDSDSPGAGDNLNFGWTFRADADGFALRIASLGANGSSVDPADSTTRVYDRDVVVEIHSHQVRGIDVDVEVVNLSGRSESLYCLRATYRDGRRVFVDLAADNVIPAAATFGPIVVDGFRKAAGSASCDAAARYEGIRATEFFAHNAFGTDQLQITIN
ncbi:MAG: prepilin-type N-terminal cleavage/methylation domain-containing protein [Pseudomonadota bacterium]